MDQIKEEISELVYELHEYLDGKEQSKDYEKLNSYALGLEESLKIDELEIIEKGTKQAEKLINWMVPVIKKNSDHGCQSPVTVVEKQTPENSTVRANQSSCNL